MDVPAIKRQLKIKTGALQRLVKENGLYAKEIGELEARREKFIEEKREEWDIKNVGKLIEESKKMVLDTQTRKTKADNELRDLVVCLALAIPTDRTCTDGLLNNKDKVKGEAALAEDEDFLKAVEALEAANL